MKKELLYPISVAAHFYLIIYAIVCGIAVTGSVFSVLQNYKASGDLQMFVIQLLVCIAISLYIIFVCLFLWKARQFFLKMSKREESDIISNKQSLVNWSVFLLVTTLVLGVLGLMVYYSIREE